MESDLAGRVPEKESEARLRFNWIGEGVAGAPLLASAGH